MVVVVTTIIFEARRQRIRASSPPSSLNAKLTKVLFDVVSCHTRQKPVVGVFSMIAEKCDVELETTSCDSLHPQIGQSRWVLLAAELVLCDDVVGRTRII